MKLKLSIILFSALLLNSLSAIADATDGTVLAIDRKALKLVLTDRTVWSLDNMEGPLPVDLKAGDRIEINFDSDEEGVSAIRNIRLLPGAKTIAEYPDMTTGTALVLDRRANILVLTDRTVWALDSLKSEFPVGLKAGDLIEIDFESDEDGVTAINRIMIISH